MSAIAGMAAASVARELARENAAKDAEIARLVERLKQAILSNASLLAETTQLRGALPALWGQYDDAGRKLWVDPKDAEIARLRETLTEARGWVQDDVNADPRRRGEDVLDRIDATLKGKEEGK